ncbi:MAG: LacI family DNA-binding transcriptional regulator [Solirubrobacterales bacterium]|nr:LacI family DNA-binding transcriptional regulator [Solirubrobacterales bacterium]MCB0859892.1 LacI family DNA-binding transcriptional regulator [Solirubrobacterales bacterium]MCB0862788.1 LacI family DNA-binding transcriptional regulator [Solirubrobacterales bacterium]
MEEASPSRIGIRDVAAAAGVSPTTVSHALSGKGRLPDETRQRIASIAEELGYRPNVNARNLVSGKTGLLGIVVSASQETPFGLGDFDYFIQLLSAATGAAVERGRALVVEGVRSGPDAFGTVEVDGAIVVDPVSDDPLIDALDRANVPVVTTGRRDRPPAGGRPECWVDNDHVEATEEILAHLESHGAKKVGLISTAPVTSYTRDAISGYKAWCSLHGQEPMISTVEGPINEGAGFRAAEELLDLADPPDAIYATLDQLALGVLAAARARSLTVPDDLMVAGCTDSQASAWADPPLTAVLLNPEEIGRSAVSTLIDLIEAGDSVPDPVVVPTGIVERESTARLTGPGGVQAAGQAGSSRDSE